MKAGLPLSGKSFLKECKITTITVVSVYGALDLVVVNESLIGLSMIESRD